VEWRPDERAAPLDSSSAFGLRLLLPSASRHRSVSEHPAFARAALRYQVIELARALESKHRKSEQARSLLIGLKAQRRTLGVRREHR
jgi:hypothetical protein